jgi:hypothetical protein
MLNLYIFIAYRHTNTIITGGGGMGFLFKKLPETHIHEYDSKTKFKRLKFDLEFSKSDTNVDVKIKYFI